MPEPEDLYQNLVDILLDRNEQVYEIEILSPGLGPLLRDGLNIGITKRALAQAYLVARGIFFNASGLGKDTNLSNYFEESTGQRSTSLDSDMKAASEIVLLFDSEHLTACNWRKRRLCALQNLQLLNAYTDALTEELSFTATLLCSPLHRHAKSPTLWYHRQWVWNLVYGLDRCQAQAVITGLQKASLGSFHADEVPLQAGALRNELSLVLRAGEQHPMNYYAFSYLRQFLLSNSRFGSEHSALQPDDRRDWREARVTFPLGYSAHTSQLLGENLLEEIHSWCLRHPGDISGWTFLLHVLELIDETSIQKSVVNKTITYACSISWEGEALWVFVALSISKFKVDIGEITPTGYVTVLHEPTPDKIRGWNYLAAQLKNQFCHPAAR